MRKLILSCLTLVALGFISGCASGTHRTTTTSQETTTPSPVITTTTDTQTK